MFIVFASLYNTNNVFIPRYPEATAKLPYRAKALFAFQKIDGVDVCFFGLHIQVNLALSQVFVLNVLGGGGGPTTKKIMPPGKTQDVLCLFCSFLFFFKTRSKSTFLCPIWSKMCPQKRTKKIMILVFFDLY